MKTSRVCLYVNISSWQKYISVSNPLPNCATCQISDFSNIRSIISAGISLIKTLGIELVLSFYLTDSIMELISSHKEITLIYTLSPLNADTTSLSVMPQCSPGSFCFFVMETRELTLPHRHSTSRKLIAQQSKRTERDSGIAWTLLTGKCTLAKPNTPIRWRRITPPSSQLQTCMQASWSK